MLSDSRREWAGGFVGSGAWDMAPIMMLRVAAAFKRPVRADELWLRVKDTTRMVAAQMEWGLSLVFPALCAWLVVYFAGH